MAGSYLGARSALIGLAAVLGCSAKGAVSSSSLTSGAAGASASSSGGQTGGGGSGGGSTSSGSSSASSGTGGAAASSSASTGGSGGASSSSSGTGGTIDPATLDQDGDGWTPADGDCCDVPGPCGANAKLINPGAFEYPGNGVDDDCDPSTSDTTPTPTCSSTALFANVGGDDLVKAMDICQFTTENPPLPMKKWGVIQTQMLLADGMTALPASDNVQTGVLTSYGPNVTPQKGATVAAISSGTARALGDPDYVHPKNGNLSSQKTGSYNGMTQVKILDTYLSPHGGKPPAPAACSAACTTGCDQAYDSVNLDVRIRVPTNAYSFSYQFKFYSSEYPEYLCQQYNDFFITLLKTSWVPDPTAMPPQAPIPPDTNVAFDSLGNPVSVNNSFFQECFPISGAPAGSCPSGTLGLVGNGMGGWSGILTEGGGTDWLTNEAPVVPGETIEIQFVIWDSGDHNVDSLVLLDHFRWSITTSTARVHN